MAPDGSLPAYVGMAIYIPVVCIRIMVTLRYDSGSKLANVSDRYGNRMEPVVLHNCCCSNSSPHTQLNLRLLFANNTADASNIDSATFNDIEFVETSNNILVLQGTSDGSGATFDVTRNGAKYYVTVNAGGQEFTRLDTVTILK